MENSVLLKAIIDNAIDGLITIDDRGIVESINPSACRLFDYAPEEVIGQNISILMPQPDRSYHDRYLFNYKQTGNANIIGIGRELIGMKKMEVIFHFVLALARLSTQAG